MKTIDNVSSSTREYLYGGSTLIAEKVNSSWTDHVYGLGLTQRGNTYQHWSWRGGFGCDGGRRKKALALFYSGFIEEQQKHVKQASKLYDEAVKTHPPSFVRKKIAR